MLIIGERLNSSREPVHRAILERNASFIIREAKRQFEAGAKILDINCAASLKEEADVLKWVLELIQNEIPFVGVCIDSPNHIAIEKALDVYKGKGEIFINSITGSRERIANILPVALRYGAKLIALTIGEDSMPKTRYERRDIALSILSLVKEMGFEEERLYFDPLVRPLATEPDQAEETLSSIGLIKEIGKVNTIIGASNISFGLPKRSVINRTFLTLALKEGLDAAIIDPLDKYVLGSLYATCAILGKDPYCLNYLKSFREGMIA